MRATAADVVRVTGQARMSYRRAAEIFTTLTRPLDADGRAWTLHQLSAARPDPCRPGGRRSALSYVQLQPLVEPQPSQT